ncbi:MAG: hypothetical protein V4598_06615 [Bdellovibrionota bacterium]
MDRKYLTPPFDMSEYIYGRKFVLGGVSFDIEEELPPVKEDIKPDALTPKDED